MNDAKIEILNGHIMATQFALKQMILMQANPRDAARRVAGALEMLVAKGLASETTSAPQLGAFETAKQAIVPTEKELRLAQLDG